MWVNGVLTGEMGLAAGVAGRYGVPVVMVSSDDAGCAEAAEFLPDVVTATTKYGLGRYMGRLLHPSETGPILEKAAKEGVERRKAIAPKLYQEPTHIKIDFNRTEMADFCARLITIDRVDAYTVEGTYPSYEEAHRVVWNLLAMSGVGLDCQW